MRDTTDDRTDDRTDDVESEPEYYLPATARLSDEPGPIERVLKTVFRRRGEEPILVRR